MANAACGGSSDDARPDDVRPDDVRITVEVGADGGPGAFTASGGAICSSGTFTTVAFEFVEGGATFRDRYECADGSGVFFIVGEVVSSADAPSYTGTWEVETGSGTGSYLDVEGSGTLTGETEPEWIVEYDGRFGRSRDGAG